MQTPQKLIDWLTEKISESGLSQAEASRRAGLSTNAINQVINGQRPSIDTLVGIAKLFGVSLGELLYLGGFIDAAALKTEQEADVARRFGALSPESRHYILLMLSAVEHDEAARTTKLG